MPSCCLCVCSIDGWSATLPLQVYGRFAAHPPERATMEFFLLTRKGNRVCDRAHRFGARVALTRVCFQREWIQDKS
jgi:hypothetical protein